MGRVTEHESKTSRRSLERYLTIADAVDVDAVCRLSEDSTSDSKSPMEKLFAADRRSVWDMGKHMARRMHASDRGGDAIAPTHPKLTARTRELTEQ